MESHTIPRNSLQSLVIWWKHDSTSCNIYKIQINLHRISCISMHGLQIHAIPWYMMRFHAILCNLLQSLVVPWKHDATPSNLYQISSNLYEILYIFMHCLQQHAILCKHLQSLVIPWEHGATPCNLFDIWSISLNISCILMQYYAIPYNHMQSFSIFCYPVETRGNPKQCLLNLKQSV